MIYNYDDFEKKSRIIHSVIQQNKDQPSEGCIGLLYYIKKRKEILIQKN